MKPILFFNDQSNGDVTKEALIDFFLSWTLRCASDLRHTDISNEVQEASKRILHFFLKDQFSPSEFNDVKVLEVETLKQWKLIDLLCVVKYEIKEELRWTVLCFENKMYTTLHGNQLEKYKKIVEDEYSNPAIDKKYIYLTNHMEIPPEDNEQCEANDYKPYKLWEIAEYLKKEYKEQTGNFLFDEFWHRYIR